MRATKINTTRYESAHGKKPRGFGLWSFETKAGDVVVTFTGFYSDAKRFVKRSEWAPELFTSA